MKSISEKKGERKQNVEENQARLAKAEGISLKGDFEHRRQGRGKSDDKAACFEFGNTDRFKAQFHTWIQKEQRRANENPTSSTKGKDQKVKKKRRKRRYRSGKVYLSGNGRMRPGDWRNTGKWGKRSDQTSKLSQCTWCKWLGREELGRRMLWYYRYGI